MPRARGAALATPAALRSARLHAAILPREPFGGHVHHPEEPRTFRGAVPIRAATRHQSVMLDEREQPGDVFRRMTGMSHFDPVDSRARERFDALPGTGMRGMREHRDSAGAMDHRDAIADRETILGNVRWPPIAEIAIEGVARV